MDDGGANATWLCAFVVDGTNGDSDPTIWLVVPECGGTDGVCDDKVQVFINGGFLNIGLAIQSLVGLVALD